MDYSIPITYTLSIHKVHKYLNWGFVHLVGIWLSAISLNVCTVGEGPTCKTLEVPPGKMHLTRVDITASVSCKSKTQTNLMANICILYRSQTSVTWLQTIYFSRKVAVVMQSIGPTGGSEASYLWYCCWDLLLGEDFKIALVTRRATEDNIATL